ncbi:MAG: phospholipase D-like domain-containing protein [Bacteriovoracaceae bacterium]
MKQLLCLALFSFSLFSHAAKLSDFKPYKYEVLFTNPVCKEYKYETPIAANNGDMLYAKPKDVYCKTSDMKTSAARENSPQFRLTEWIRGASTKEIFMAYLSFSNNSIAAELCNAVKRGVKLSIILDNGAGGETGEPAENQTAEGLKNCAKGPTAGQIDIQYRGNEGGIGFAHNKILAINANDSKEFKMVFSSGNMSSGTAIHHENWNFITTSQESYFAQAHKCLMKGMVGYGKSKTEFTKFMNECRSEITSAEESDIKSFFVPADGDRAFAALHATAMKAKMVEIAAHRFSGKFLSLSKELTDAGKTVRLVTDDDIYWSAKTKVDTGRNTVAEATSVMKMKNDVELKFMQTNQAQELLQHNKFMIFHGAKAALWTGAGNLTSSAFSKNYENFYLITIPEVVDAFKAQYTKFWEKMATTAELMPSEQILP